ncbi:hypothetical protein FJZ21_02140 [Candidatus Pacearchaeota archaeon]|nr:hypothetical protein [Candidatus Pacearchaeota archaeon]
MFKKRESIDILDIPELHRKKLIKLPEAQKHQETKLTNDGYFIISEKRQETQQTAEVKQETINPVSNFLSDFASIGATNPQVNPEIKTESKQEDNTEVKDLKWRLENLEFKLDQLIERVNSINR